MGSSIDDLLTDKGSERLQPIIDKIMDLFGDSYKGGFHCDLDGRGSASCKILPAPVKVKSKR
jgi:hypothetical protein